MNLGTFDSTGGRSRFFAFMLLAVVGIVGMLAMACGGDDDDDDTEEETPTEAASETSTEDAGEASATEDAAEASATESETSGNEAGGTLKFGYVAGWDEGVASTYLWKHLLEEQGFTVEVTQLDVAPLFAAIAQGDVDLYTDAWLPGTHQVYMDEFGEDIVELHTWYEEAGLYLTVPSYVDVESLEDLAGMSDTFDGRIVGIEPGAGMMGILRDSVMPAYGLDDWELVESATGPMLAELDSAIAAEEPIVVTLWSPGWWYGAYDLKNLADPQQAWGDPDHISIVTRTGFEEDFPQVAEWMSNMQFEDEPLAELENFILDAGEGNIEQGVETWLAEGEYASVVEGWVPAE